MGLRLSPPCLPHVSEWELLKPERKMLLEPWEQVPIPGLGHNFLRHWRRSPLSHTCCFYHLSLRLHSFSLSLSLVLQQGFTYTGAVAKVGVRAKIMWSQIALENPFRKAPCLCLQHIKLFFPPVWEAIAASWMSSILAFMDYAFKRITLNSKAHNMARCPHHGKHRGTEQDQVKTNS